MKSSAPSIGREARNCPLTKLLYQSQEKVARRNDLLHYSCKTSSERWTNIEALLHSRRRAVNLFEMNQGGSCSDGSEWGKL